MRVERIWVISEVSVLEKRVSKLDVRVGKVVVDRVRRLLSVRRRRMG